MSELEQRFNRVLGGMLGNESLAETLDETAASELLAWGQAAAKHIVNETDGLDEDAAQDKMAPRLRALRLMMRAVGRWTGEADSLDRESRLALWDRVGEQARVLFGDSFVLPSMDDVLRQLPSDADSGQVIVWLKGLFENQNSKG